ncbi:hypothetical protein RRG08_034599 [Elysia crispata]|uniref:Uncharacterized protein n=1 Tax=Elysia crispata TaxID=231223 RepID=A0AAE1B1M2_9GAST|nr:hypothetical protein RRG08_034599 [Elysia crispata]
MIMVNSTCWATTARLQTRLDISVQLQGKLELFDSIGGKKMPGELAINGHFSHYWSKDYHDYLYYPGPFITSIHLNPTLEQ